MFISGNAIVGGDDGFNALLYPEQNINNFNYIQRQFEGFNNYIQPISDIGNSFLLETKKLYEQAKNSDSLRLARMAINQVRSLTKPNIITYLNRLEDIQTAGTAMQRWIMANPEINELYNDKRINGYSDTFIDFSEGQVGDNNYNYCRVNDGVINVNEDNYKYKHYYEELLPDDRELTSYEKCDILDTWDAIKVYISLTYKPV